MQIHGLQDGQPHAMRRILTTDLLSADKFHSWLSVCLPEFSTVIAPAVASAIADHTLSEAKVGTVGGPVHNMCSLRDGLRFS